MAKYNRLCSSRYFLNRWYYKKNIAFGINDDEIDNKNIEYAIRTSQLSNVVNNIENNLDAIVGEKGIKLSGGQNKELVLPELFIKNLKS